ncbi:tRNA (adenosine(37)-N6)-dimethylallyltransferase MiaA [Methylococcus capsulatus]|uniref:tRNA (adenosine(37)-N6)-dimethylallyltransferase MiaA n=1 Tax=Methylococcus capsulatus TaxID=414 RepID=UPI001C52D605|nr:tRNA (adenosine(37)-N6)-dimethylallyltransferase MiaA [Methylococcus capsulatus]QXP87647.1 tRNA (adenosine(37)-N6)-dimethylallyltransferase MiaA [Methylococcus capsulatus]QXP92614.1 tRNA (adenosine(37)-N6)-dimethylallyltransferase MiaA [Methylococcus capsulatus]UQN12663.1 tRNA (adenosine(37)-N6)-dimethylallyltransferase MiaA [Methylococcus capsulatus]
MSAAELPPVVVLMGPTASGKSQLAIELANALDGEIVSVDSSLVYRGMDIGTAKPTPTERAAVPHHLIDVLDPSEVFSTGRFRDEALALIADITARGRLPVLAGGTMLYFNALLRGLAELPSADPDLRREIETRAARDGWHALHAELARIDPPAAARIHPNDPQRLQRALEVFYLTGRTLSDLCEGSRSPELPFRPLRIVLAPSSRAVLAERIAERFRRMLDEGFLEEVEALYRRGDLNETLPSIRAVGYRQAWGYLQGDYGFDTFVERAIIATRQFAKRQCTWLRKETEATWLETGTPGLSDRAAKEVRARL